MLVVLERSGELFVDHFWLIMNLRRDRYSGARLLGLYRMRGKAGGAMGELLDALAPAFSSAARPKSHYRGRPLEAAGRPEESEVRAQNEKLLLLKLLAYELLDAGRCVMQQGTGVGSLADGSVETLVGDDRCMTESDPKGPVKPGGRLLHLLDTYPNLYADLLVRPRLRRRLPDGFPHSPEPSLHGYHVFALRGRSTASARQATSARSASRSIRSRRHSRRPLRPPSTPSSTRSASWTSGSCAPECWSRWRTRGLGSSPAASTCRPRKCGCDSLTTAAIAAARVREVGGDHVATQLADDHRNPE